MLEVPYLQKGYNFYEITHDINSYINEIFNSNFVLKTAGLFSLKIIYSDTNSSYKDNMVLKYFIDGEYQKKNKEYRSLSRIVKVKCVLVNGFFDNSSSSYNYTYDIIIDFNLFFKDDKYNSILPLWYEINGKSYHFMIDNIPYIIYPIIREKREILVKKLASKGYDGSKIQKFFYEIFNIIDKKTNAIAKISKKMISNCSLETDFASATTEFLMSTGTMVRFKNNYKFPNKEEFKNIIVTYFNNYVRIYNEVSNILDSAINSNF